MSENVLDLLTHDHHEVAEMVDEILTTEEPQRRRELADTVIGQLVRHSVAEETIVYPVMRAELPDGEQAVEHDTEEHKQLEVLMKEMESVDAVEPRFLELVGRLKDVLRDHVSDEEQDQFPKLRASLSEERLTAMGAQVAVRKKVAPTRPHPEAPNNALFHLTVGPGVGLVDRLRDALSSRTTG